MPLHLASTSSKSRSRLPPRLSLSRKSTPTCTLSLAHVSACKLENSIQVELDLSTLHFVAVPMPPSPKRTTTTISNDINVIPFPTSTQTTPSSDSPTLSHTTNSFKRQQGQKKQDLPVSSSVSPPRKRARKGNLSTSPPSSSRSDVPSPRARALAQRVPPNRPPTPTPDSRSDGDMSVTDKPLVQPSSATEGCTVPSHQSQSVEKGQDLEKHGHPDLPPYSPSPPPYSPPVVVSPIPLHLPVPVVPPSSSSEPTSSTTPPPLPSPRPLPVSSPPPPPPSTPLPPPSPQRKSRISPSELRFFIFLYRTVVSGLEMRQQNRLNTQQVYRARDGSRREQHLDGVLVEVDDDDDVDIDLDHDPNVDPMDTTTTTNESSLNEDLEGQDALLALRLRGFLKWNGVEEWMLKVDSSSSSSMNSFLEDDTTQSHPEKMDVDQAPLPLLSSRHLITVLRMRGTCGSRQGGPIGMKFKKNKSKLRMCAFNAEGDD